MLPAQGTFLTSPAQLQSAAGSQALPVVEGTGTRWQQIHGDLLGSPGLIRGFRLRRDETLPVLPIATAQQILIEVWMGEVDIQSVTRDFLNNLGPAPVQVLPASTVQLPDWVAGIPGPGTFDLDVQLVVPFAYSGTQGLVVEVRTILGSTTHIADAHGEGGNEQTPLDLGSGCSAGFLPYIQNSRVTSAWAVGQQPTLQWNLSAFSSPLGLPGFFVVGTQTLPVSVPWLCTTVWPTLDLIVPAVQTAVGPIAVNAAPTIETPFVASLVGNVFTTQAVSFDVTPTGPTFLLSQGQQLTVAPLPPLPLPLVSLRGDLSSTLAQDLTYGGRILQFEF